MTDSKSGNSSRLSLLLSASSSSSMSAFAGKQNLSQGGDKVPVAPSEVKAKDVVGDDEASESLSSSLDGAGSEGVVAEPKKKEQ